MSQLPAPALSLPSLLDQGYDALREGAWEEAARCFDSALQLDPASGFACLGKAMSVNRIHRPGELARHWEDLSRQTGFQDLLSPAPGDFLSWLQDEMERLRGPEPSDIPASASEPDSPELTPVSPGRKLLLIFAAWQVLLYLGCALCLWLSDPLSESPGIAIPGCLIAAALFCGLPVILGPVYGNSIVEAGRFETVLKILNIITSIVGGLGTAILVLAFYSGWQTGGTDLREQMWSCFAYVLAFLTYVSALVFPMILNKVEYG